jgi:citrate lyase subunit beta/citryl-CoA lyase/(S)-citramalyl-CoA lyase
VNPRRCILFVPGSRAERFEKAMAADADQVCIDWEDAVPHPEKATARAVSLAFLAKAGTVRSEVGVRINPAGSAEGAADLASLRGAAVKPAFVMIAKTEGAHDVQAVQAALGAVPLIALLESPAAMFAARDIARASATVQALMFGGYDYAVAARVAPRSAGWDWPRAVLANAAAEAQVGAIDVPSLELDDADAIRNDTHEAIARGFTGRAAIHPRQVPVIQSAFLPSAPEAERAQRIVEAANAARGGAFALDGRMVDRPIEIAARRALALAAFGVRAA